MHERKFLLDSFQKRLKLTQRHVILFFVFVFVFFIVDFLNFEHPESNF